MLSQGDVPGVLGSILHIERPFLHRGVSKQFQHTTPTRVPLARMCSDPVNKRGMAQCADPEANPSALTASRNAPAMSPDISRTLAPTVGAQAPADVSTTNDSSETVPPLGSAIAQRNRGSHPRFGRAPAPVRPAPLCLSVLVEKL